MTLDTKARLEIQADVDGDGTEETGVFEFAGDVEITESLRTGFLVGGRGSSINGIVQGAFGKGEAKRKGVYLDLGGGQHTFQIQFRGWERAQDKDGNNLRWGDGSGTKPADAQGLSPTEQINCLINYIRIGTIDSRGGATFKWGEYSSSGSLENSLPVAIEQPQLTYKAGTETAFDGSLTLVEVLTLNDFIDGVTRKNDR